MAAIPVSKYENGKHCNKKMRICNANNRSKCVTVRIVDSCAGDACKEFDLSSTAAEELGGDNIKVVYGPADGSLSEETETVSKVPKHNVSASETKVSAETVTPTASATTTTPCPEETRSTQASTEASTTPCPDEHVSETSTTPCPEETTATEEGKSTSTTTPCPEEDSYQNDKETEKGEEKEKSTSEVIGDQFGGYVSASSTIGYSIVALLSMFVLNVYQ
ncbi:hypothetical protein O9G_002273 [Rozella allomycis CSF55]|uniref:RlpA-like protein double-psi beta-barrel domain-containing protein n=1 Tax=Rozella allomycis (strain CSF55) TaxID=988480 RepID=A0A075B4J1_ROZAC|nr:hypothetical protein O9G_002273 [Rozella allomycis CSF55]|eukprot:EPZ36207.1 hypothetical protein O9G_002273 [Rozella allomycis CSF55]